MADANKMRIALIITCLGVGGAERVVVSLADALADRGHDVMIAYLKGPAIVKPENPTVRVVGLGLESARNLVGAYLSLRAALAKFRPDVVHSHLIHANILSRFLRLSMTIPRLITSAHNRNEEGRFRMLAYRLSDRLTDITTNVSDEAVDAFIEQKAVRASRIITVHNGIAVREYWHDGRAAKNVRAELNIDPETMLLVAVGRLCEPKDYPNMLVAFSRLKISHSRYKLVIAGDGPMRNELLQLADRLGVGDRVQFLGVRRDIQKLLSAADIFVLSSAWEGFPMVVGEAMACECVVVATDCGGVEELVGSEGFLVPPGNPDLLARRIEAALTLSFEERERIGRKARERVTRLYSLDAAVDKWLALYANDAGASSQPQC